MTESPIQANPVRLIRTERMARARGKLKILNFQRWWWYREPYSRQSISGLIDQSIHDLSQDGFAFLVFRHSQRNALQQFQRHPLSVQRIPVVGPR